MMVCVSGSEDLSAGSKRVKTDGARAAAAGLSLDKKTIKDAAMAEESKKLYSGPVILF
jgi:hypothetical protein